jgi:hypothetical protein
VPDTTACYLRSHEILTALALLQMHKKTAKSIHIFISCKLQSSLPCELFFNDMVSSRHPSTDPKPSGRSMERLATLAMNTVPKVDQLLSSRTRPRFIPRVRELSLTSPFCCNSQHIYRTRVTSKPRTYYRQIDIYSTCASGSSRAHSRFFDYTRHSVLSGTVC